MSRLLRPDIHVNGDKNPQSTYGAPTPGYGPPTPMVHADDNIKRFSAPSRAMTPVPGHTLFHPKTRCFV